MVAHVYSKHYNTPSTRLRFFMVYGPTGRPPKADAVGGLYIINTIQYHQLFQEMMTK